MKRFIIYNTFGEILRAGNAPDDMIAIQAQPGESVMEGTADEATQYVEGGQIVDKPTQPSPHHIFDYTLKQWVDPRTLDDLKRLKWAGIKQAQALEEASGFAWNGSTFDSSRTSQERIRTAAQAATVASLKGAPYKVDWVLRDNTSRALTGPDMLEVAAALWAHIAALHARAQILRQRIEAAGSAGALDKIVW